MAIGGRDPRAARATRSSTTGRQINYPSTGQGTVGGYASPALARAQQFQERYPDEPYDWNTMVDEQSAELDYFLGRGAYANPGGGTTTPSYGGGGGYGYGGGGGGGGGSAITQAMIDAMARALSTSAPQFNAPAFQGQALGAFNAAPYTTALGQINQAVTADQANIAANQAAVTQQLQQNYSNPYTSAQVVQAPQQSQVGVGLTATAGGGGSTAATNEVNAAAAGDQAGFQNLLNVLAAANQQSQNSRMAQVGMDANYARQGLDASALGLRGGVNMAQANAQNQWQQQAAERDYQNNLMAQQWARESAQTNYQTNLATWQARLQPILDMIANSGGRAGLNFDALIRALGGV